MKRDTLTEGLLYEAAVEEADEATAAALGEVWNRNIRAVRASRQRAQASARAKADPFDTRVRNLLTNIEQRRKVPVPPRDRVGKIAAAILLADGGNIDSIKARVRDSLARQGLR